mmetsp:Transcript_78236/g.147696  ORF Transcript_78236/g.147696 Transcript_78236/m.147696 type:complete len:86 (+) Transcript_78236:210-467(+)
MASWHVRGALTCSERHFALLVESECEMPRSAIRNRTMMVVGGAALVTRSLQKQMYRSLQGSFYVALVQTCLASSSVRTGAQKSST